MDDIRRKCNSIEDLSKCTSNKKKKKNLSRVVQIKKKQRREKIRKNMSGLGTQKLQANKNKRVRTIMRN